VITRALVTLSLAALTFALTAALTRAPTARADAWCARPLAVHEWGVHVYGPDAAPLPGDATSLPPWFVRPPAHGPAARPPVRTLPADTGVRRLPVVTIWSPAPPTAPIPFALEVGFTRGTASVWYPDVDRLLPTTSARELVWDRLDLAASPSRPPSPTDIAWVLTNRGFDGALWVDGQGPSERFVFYEADTREPSPLVLTKAAGSAPGRRRLTLSNRGRHPVHDVFLIHAEGATRHLVHVPTLAAGASTIVTIEDHHVGDLSRAGRERLRAALVLPHHEPAQPGPGDACVMGRDPAVPFTRTIDHRLNAPEIDLLLATWGERFFDRPGTRILYREDVAYLDEAMPLSLYTDMFHTIVLRRAGLALREGVTPPL